MTDKPKKKAKAKRGPKPRVLVITGDPEAALRKLLSMKPQKKKR